MMACVPRMTMQRIVLSVLISVPVCSGGNVYAAESAGVEIAPVVTAYFKQYCYHCHSDNVQKGDRRLVQFFKTPATRNDSMSLLEEALDAINRGDMPPEKNGVVQPPADETRDVVARMTD